MEGGKRKNRCLLTDKAMAWKFLAGVKLSSLHPNIAVEDFYEEPETASSKPKIEEPEMYIISNAMTCSLCDANFETRHQQKSHYRLDWHRFNLKRRMMGLKSVSEDKFTELADDVSSISGSGDSSSSSDETDMSPKSHEQDRHSNHSAQASPGRRKKVPSVHKYESEDDSDDSSRANSEGNGRRHPRLYFENDEGNVVSVYRCIVHGKREAPTSHSELITRTLNLLMKQKWAILMTGGGHFAAAVYNGSDVVAHKTFHRYTVRAKRGTVQSIRDSQGNAPKSAGASIRRHNEAALNQEVQDLLASWKPHLDSCTRIFVRAPNYNRNMFYGGKNPSLSKSDQRVVTIPFATRRATFKEVQRVWELLATVDSHGTVDEVEASFASPKKTEWKKGRKPLKDEGGKNEEPQKEEELKPTMGSVMNSLMDRLVRQCLQDDDQNLKQRMVSETKQELKEMEEKEKDEDETSIGLTVEDEVMTFDHLKQYEVTKKKPAKKKKKKQENSFPGKDSDEEILTNELYTVCRTGNLTQLDAVLAKIQQKYSSLPAAPDTHTESAPEDRNSFKYLPEHKQPNEIQYIATTRSINSCNGKMSENENDSLNCALANMEVNVEFQSKRDIKREIASNDSAEGVDSTLEAVSSLVSSYSSTPKSGMDSETVDDASTNSTTLCENVNISDITQFPHQSVNQYRTQRDQHVTGQNENLTDVQSENTISSYQTENQEIVFEHQRDQCDKNSSDIIGRTENGTAGESKSGPASKDQDFENSSDSTDRTVGVRPSKEFYKFLNKSLDDLGYTFLHVAAEDGQREVLYKLMELGADPGIKNKKGKPPFGCSLDKKTKDEFKRFRTTYPDRYDYERAQIPAPLSEDQEKEKAAKQAEKKRNARRAKRAKEKEQKEAQAEERKKEEEKRKEEEKKEWYANLSDREKRALAAEKRLAQQTASTPELQRCWSCGSSLAGKTPFSYMDFRFCSMACLKQHKASQKT